MDKKQYTLSSLAGSIGTAGIDALFWCVRYVINKMELHSFYCSRWLLPPKTFLYLLPALC